MSGSCRASNLDSVKITQHLDTVKIEFDTVQIPPPSWEAMAKRTAYHHGDLRRALLEASQALLDESGLGALSLREVARKAGVSHNAPYHHFPDRGSLLAALAEEGFADLARQMAAARAAAPDARARLEACGLAYVRFALRSPARFKLMFRPELAAPDAEGAVARSSSAALETLAGAILEAQQAGLAPAGDPMPLVLTCWSAVHGLASLWLDGPLPRSRRIFPGTPEQLAGVLSSTLASLLIAGAAAPGGPGARARGTVARPPAPAHVRSRHEILVEHDPGQVDRIRAGRGDRRRRGRRQTGR
jgi:AcrR family transcriptional regulator